MEQEMAMLCSMLGGCSTYSKVLCLLQVACVHG